jgi:hypothetical protein
MASHNFVERTASAGGKTIRRRRRTTSCNCNSSRHARHWPAARLLPRGGWPLGVGVQPRGDGNTH